MNKLTLVHQSTPLYKLNFKVGRTNIFIKREDMIEFAFGGNKVRLFEYVAAGIKGKYEKLITFGSMHSNHIRVAAAVAAFLGMDCDLIILTTDGKTVNSPNMGLAKLCGNVKISICKTDDAHDYIDEYMAEQNAKDVKFFWVPGGCHTPVAALGYADTGREIQKQLYKMGVEIDAVFVPCGTGTTQAGLLAGIGEIPIYGVTVARTIERCMDEIGNLLRNMKDQNLIFTDLKDRINVLYSDKRYGTVDKDIIKIIKTLATTDGVFLDPVYNAKTFWSMIQFINKNSELKNVLYINTGGGSNYFNGGIQVE